MFTHSINYNEYFTISKIITVSYDSRTPGSMVGEEEGERGEEMGEGRAGEGKEEEGREGEGREMERSIPH